MTTSTPHTPANKLALTVTYYLSFIMLGALVAVEGPALPGFAENTSSTYDQISLIFIFGSSGYLLGSLLSGQAFDRLPAHRTMAGSFVFVAIFAVLVPFATRLWILLAVLFVLGMAKSGIDVGGNTLLLWVHGKESGPYMNGLHFFFGLGASIAPLILAGILSLTGNIRWVFWIFSLLSLPLAFWLWRLPEPPPQTTAQENGDGPFPFIPVALLVMAFLLYVGSEVSYGNWIYTYALTLGLGTEITSAYLTSAFWSAFTLGRLLGIWISARVRPFAILVIDLVGCLASLGLIMLWPESDIVLWISSTGLGLFMASVFPTILLLAGERMQVTGVMTGWFLAGASLGAMFLPWGIGQAFAGYGAGAMPALVFLTIAANLLVILLFLSRPTVKPQSVQN